MEQGRKDDTEKLPWHLLPMDPLEDVVRVLAMGAHKYAPDNWKHVYPKERYYSALMRHLGAWKYGEQMDKESGLNHLAHVLCNALFLFWHDTHPQQRIYIAGPMTGYEDYNFPCFLAAEEKLKRKGCDVANPARYSQLVWDSVGKENATREDYYRIDFRELTKCDAVYFLNGWEQSEGANLEHTIAKSMGLTLMYESDEDRIASQ